MFDVIAPHSHLPLTFTRKLGYRPLLSHQGITYVFCVLMRTAKPIGWFMWVRVRYALEV
jgi:hypothetical protein